MGGADAYAAASKPSSAPISDDAAARRRADIKLAAAIREIDYDLGHHRCKMLIPQLAAYGAGTLINQWNDNTLFIACERAGVGKLLPPPLTWPMLAGEFLEDVAWQAAPRFITRSLPRWTPEGGASINSFYVNYCYFEFKRHYVPFRRKESWRHHQERLAELGAPELLNAPAPDNPERQALSRRTYDEMLAAAELQNVRSIVELLQQGKTYQQIADDLGISINTVGRRIAAYRRTLERNGWYNGGNGGR